MIREKIAPILLKLYKPCVIKYLQNNRSVFHNEKELRKYQQTRLEKLILHAYESTKYYKEIFDEIDLISVGKINWKKFSEIPILTKEIIKKHHDDLIAKDAKSRKLYTNTSGGSTGVPVIFTQDDEYYERMVADTLWFSELYGKKIGEKEIKIWGSEKDIFKEKESLINRLINYFFNRTLLNSFKLNNEIIDKYLDNINAVKPKSKFYTWRYCKQS